MGERRDIVDDIASVFGMLTDIGSGKKTIEQVAEEAMGGPAAETVETSKQTPDAKATAQAAALATVGTPSNVVPLKAK